MEGLGSRERANGEDGKLKVVKGVVQKVERGQITVKAFEPLKVA